MKFNFKTLSLFLASAAVVLTGCKDDVLSDAGRQTGSGRYVHVAAGISLPSASRSRSATDTVGNNGGLTNSDGLSSDTTFNGPDYEYGYDYENEIRTMILLYATKNNAYIAHSVVNGITKAPLTNNAYDYEVKAELDHDKLAAAYESGPLSGYDPTSDEIRVFAFCNYTANLETQLNNLVQGDTTWVNLAGKVEEAGSPASHQPTIQNTIWAPRSFLMTNASISNAKFPADIDGWDDYADQSNPWKLNVSGDQTAELGRIFVERSAARIDFRDGSEGENTYPIKLHPNSYADQVENSGTDAGNINVLSVKLTRMSLVNMSKNFYYLRRVSANGLNAGSLLCGVETAGSVSATGAPFVVDTDAAEKNSETGMSVSTAKNNFNFPLYLALTDTTTTYNKSEWYTDNLSTILDREDNVDTWTGSGTNKYHIWRYVTENTMPSAQSQRTVQSVGVVFKGKLINGTDSLNTEAVKYLSADVRDALTNVGTAKDQSPVLYSYENRLFAGPWDLIAAAVEDGQGSALYGAVNKALAAWKEETPGSGKYSLNGSGESLNAWVANDLHNAEQDSLISDLTDAKLSPAAPDAGITVYRASNEQDGEGWGYYCYYFYWNRHNDNLKSGLMGNMEFATVRNNVYKLSVTSIKKLGHPTNPDDDTDREDPEDPDEDPTNYIQVNVEVLPWVVRLNNIEF